jgi:CDP-diacylglycerol--glycerol-3-phosphate 3-phosphatidyltransferase
MNIIVLENEMNLAGLRRQWAVYALLGGLFFSGGFLGLRAWWEPVFAGRWLVISLAVFVYELSTVWKNLKTNHRANEEVLLPSLGAGNLVSLLRGALIAGLYGFLVLPQPEGWLAWIPGVLYTTAAVADSVDGVLARLTNRTTKFGEIMDMYFDGLGMLAATGFIVLSERVPAWYLLIGLARYFFLFGMELRRRLGKVNHEMPFSVRRRWMAAVQMGFVSVMMWPLFSPPATQIVAYAFGIPLLIGFLWDWLYVSGVISPEDVRHHHNFTATLRLWIPVGLRLAVLICALPTWLNGQGFLWVEWIVFLLLLIGAAGRAASIAGLVALGFTQFTGSLTNPQLVQSFLYAFILLLGTGVFSVWTPEDRLVFKKIGEKIPGEGARLFKAGAR